MVLKVLKLTAGVMAVLVELLLSGKALVEAVLVDIPVTVALVALVELVTEVMAVAVAVVVAHKVVKATVRHIAQANGRDTEAAALTHLGKVTVALVVIGMSNTLMDAPGPPI